MSSYRTCSSRHGPQAQRPDQSSCKHLSISVSRRRPPKSVSSNWSIRRLTILLKQLNMIGTCCSRPLKTTLSMLTAFSHRMARTVQAEPSLYMQELTRYLSVNMNSVLLGLPTEVKELIYFDALSHAANMILVSAHHIAHPSRAELTGIARLSPSHPPSTASPRLQRRP